MLDIKALRADPKQIAQALAIKGYVLDSKQFTEIEEITDTITYFLVHFLQLLTVW